MPEKEEKNYKMLILAFDCCNRGTMYLHYFFSEENSSSNQFCSTSPTNIFFYLFNINNIVRFYSFLKTKNSSSASINFVRYIIIFDIGIFLTEIFVSSK